MSLELSSLPSPSLPARSELFTVEGELEMADDSFSQFCGNSSIFDTSLLLDSDWPAFTPCFQNSLLVWVPCGWLWLLLPAYLPYLLRLHDGVRIQVNVLNTLKTLLCLLLAILVGVEMLRAGDEEVDDGSKVATVIYVSGGLKMATFLLAGGLVQVERVKGVVTSGVLWLFWFFLTIAGIVPFYTKIHQEEYNSSLFMFALYYIYFALVLTQLVLHSFAERLGRHGYQFLGQKPSPEVLASFPSRLVFWWINSLVVRAYRHGLTQDDLFDLHPRDQSARVVPEFQAAWERELQRADKRNRERTRRAAREDVYVWYRHGDKVSHHAQQHEPTETTSLLASTDVSIGNGAVKGGKPDKKSKMVEASLFRVLVKTYGLEFIKSFVCKLIYDLLQFVGPMLLDVLIAYTNHKDTEAQWKGYVYACAMFVVAVAASVFFHQQFHISMTLGMRIKSALISALYRKALTLSNEARKGSTVGEIVNLMSVDTQRLQDVAGYLWSIWSSPLQIALALALLWGQLGVSVLAGLAIMVLLIPVNAVVATKTRKYQMQQMKLKDARLKLMNEVLSGIKVLKLYAWEKSFEEKVSDIRNKELQVLRKSAYLNAFSTFVWTCAPFLVTLATFATYVLASEDHYLDAQKAFVSLSLFNILRFPINMLPMIITYIAQAQVSVSRIGAFLRNSDLNSSNVHYDSNAEEAVLIDKGTFTWDTQLPTPTLRNINLKIQRGQLVAVVGQVGAGKSSLVSAMLGELEKLSGHVVVQSSVAYVAQQAWIQNATLRDNVLFGSPYHQRQYDKVLDACALRPDLDILPGGDMTEIGEKGINLSGGQKQRVSLARAVYSDADIYLLDDPLSAVDSHVGKHIFQQVIGSKGLLHRKTRVLVTHGVHWLPMCDVIVVMTDGRISEMGSYDELLSHGGDFAQFLKTFFTQNPDSDDDDPEIQAIKAKILERVDSVTSDTAATSGDEQVSKRHTASRPTSAAPSEKKDKTDNPKDKEKPAAAKDKLIEEEKSEKGKVKMAVFMNYFRAIGLGVSALVLLLFAVYQSLSLYSSIWLSDWTDDALLANSSLRNTSQYQDRNYLYLGVYGALGVGQAIAVLAYSVLASVSMVTAAGNLHSRMLSNVLRAPMMFFDTTPSGRIVNRFSSDVAVVDNTLPATLRMVMLQVFGVIGTLIIISYSTPIFLSVVVPLGFLYYLVQRFYIPTSRELKRIESTTRSPIFNHFSETITGAASIRAYKCQQRFIDDNASKVDTNLVFYFAGIASNRWLGFRLEFLGNLVILAAAMFAVGTPDLHGGLVGLSVSYAMQVTQGLNWMVRMVSDLETNVVSVERLKEYSESATEADWVLPGRRPPRGWPEQGSVNFVGYSTRYRPGLDLVLKDLSIDIQGGQKVGIVGRTGAGKSSMTVALFRLIEAASGSIVIDGQVIGHMGLHDLRSRLTILPQDPVLFSGSLRMNLDPFDEYSDVQLWQVLEHAHLKKFVSEIEAGLLYECGEGGSNLSVGQRQLVCLARSLLRKTKILVLDEATAAVDMETDHLIQRTIRTEFRDCTVLTIAHRLNTIMDYDRILVMDQGVVKEYDSPSVLLQNKNSIFYSMARDANLV